VDMVCVGEGENALVDYLETLNPSHPTYGVKSCITPLDPL